MSFWTEKWAYEQQPGSSGAKFVLVCLAHYADENAYCYPSQKKLAAMTGMKERTVRSHLAQLEEDGYIRREERRADSGYRTSDGIWLKMEEHELKLPAEIAAENLTGKKQQPHRQKTATSPAKSAGLYRDEQSGNRKVTSSRDEPKENPLPDDTTTTCLRILQSVKGFPRDQGENAIKLAEYREEYPDVDAIEVCRDFKVYTEETGKKPNRIRLRNFFKQAAKNPPRDKKPAMQTSGGEYRGGKQEPKKTRKDYSWWLRKDTA